MKAKEVRSSLQGVGVYKRQPVKKEKDEKPKPEDKVDISSHTVDDTIDKMVKYAKGNASKLVEEAKAKDKRFTNNMADVKGAALGLGLDLGYTLSGLSTFIHEHGHAAMVESLYKDPLVQIQLDSVDNLKNLIKDPTFENLKRFLTMYDVNQDNAAGVTRYTFGDGLNSLGEFLGEDTSKAIICAMGCVAEEVPVFLSFALGFKMRKSHPLLGYSLMAFAGMHHFSVSFYPLSALWMNPNQVKGHDWLNFAQVTGIPPAVTATVFAASLPALGAAMYYMEKRQQNKQKDILAVMNLIQKGKITPEDMEKAFKEYKGAKNLQKAQENLAHLLHQSGVDVKSSKFKRKLRKNLKKLRKEYDNFSLYLAKKYRPLVDEEKKNIKISPSMTPKRFLERLKEDLKKGWKEDKVETSLSVGAKVGWLATAFSVPVAVGAVLTGSSTAAAVASTLGAALPFASLFSTSSSIWKARKVFKNPKSGKIDKLAAISNAVFSGITTAGVFALGLPAVAVGVGGMLGTAIVKAMINKFK